MPSVRWKVAVVGGVIAGAAVGGAIAVDGSSDPPSDPVQLPGPRSGLVSNESAPSRATAVSREPVSAVDTPDPP
jgi:hypothetical protein